MKSCYSRLKKREDSKILLYQSIKIFRNFDYAQHNLVDALKTEVRTNGKVLKLKPNELSTLMQSSLRGLCNGPPRSRVGDLNIMICLPYLTLIQAKKVGDLGRRTFLNINLLLVQAFDVWGNGNILSFLDVHKIPTSGQAPLRDALSICFPLLSEQTNKHSTSEGSIQKYIFRPKIQHIKNFKNMSLRSSMACV